MKTSLLPHSYSPMIGLMMNVDLHRVSSTFKSHTDPTTKLYRPIGRYALNDTNRLLIHIIR
jgi:hypothetical protein